MNLTKTKICGITTLDDALFAEKSGADALGFNFYEKGKRYIDPDKCAEITEQLSPFTVLFGVFVNEEVAKVVKIVKKCGLHVVQLHGDENNNYIDELRANINVKIVKVLRIKDAAGVAEMNKYDSSCFLADVYCEEFGGSGKRIDMDICRKLVGTGKNIIIAGGLTPENVAEVVSQLRPYGVDTASGVEVSPGIKDNAKVEQFIAQAKTA